MVFNVYIKHLFEAYFGRAIFAKQLCVLSIVLCGPTLFANFAAGLRVSGGRTHALPGSHNG